jgi:acetyl-CoA synthetase
MKGGIRMAKLEWETTDRVLKEERFFKPGNDVLERANITQYMRSKGCKTWDEIYRWSIENPEKFWEEMAKELDWFAPWKKVLDWKPPYAKWFVDAKCNAVYNALDRHVRNASRNKVALYWEGEDGTTRTLSYSDLYYEVSKFANVLKNIGLQKQERVCIYLPRIPEQIIAMLGVARIGGVHSVVYSGFSAQALQDRIKDAEASIVITSDGSFYRAKVVELKKIVDEALRDCPSVRNVIVVRRTGAHVSMLRGRDAWWHDLMALAKPYEECEHMDSEDMLYTLYTSGTTGKPKGVIHVHGGFMVGTYATMKFVFDIKPEDVYWCTADPGWVTGHSYIVYGPLAIGATNLFYEGAPDYPNPGRWWEMIERYRVSVLYTTPTAIRALMRFGDGWPRRYNLSSLRLLGTVGEPINPAAWTWYYKLAGERCPVMDTWWQTETGMQLITPVPITPLKPGSATRPFLGIEADVVDKNGNPVPDGKGGYLVIKKPWPAMLRGIFKDPERYQSYWQTIPGVYFAGDAAHKDSDGYFWIQGRVDDVIKRAGYRLGSMEIESALVSHPSVAEAAVVGKPDEVRGESIKAFVILRSGYSGSDHLANDLRQHVKESIGPIAVPEEIEFVATLPKTRSGKIMRRVLKAKELGEPVGDISTLEE